MKEGKYQVFFDAYRAEDHDLPQGSIIISVEEGLPWNDLGFAVQVQLEVIPFFVDVDSSHFWHARAFLGVIGDGDPRGGDLNDWHAATKNSVGLIPVETLPRFFTMLPDMESYRRIVQLLGPEEARSILTALNDVVAAEAYGTPPTWLKPATSNEVFRRAFLRNSESYFAWKNAAPVLRGLEFEEVRKVSDGLKVVFQLEGRPMPHALTFRFETDETVLPKRFAVIIGKNGVGKSQTLGHIVNAALAQTTGLTDSYGRRPSLNRLLAFSSSSAAASAFPGDRRKRPKIWYKRFLLNHPGQGRNRQSSSDLVLQLARRKEYIAGTLRYELFLKALTAIDDWKSLALRQRRGFGEPVSLQTLHLGGEDALVLRSGSINERMEVVRCVGRRTYPLSSGELSFLRFAAQASLYIENGSLLLFDEPETHLHPNFISRFVAILDSLLEETGSIAIIATHSAYFVREAFEDQVLVLRTLPDGTPHAQPPTLKTFGANVGAISYFVFGEDEPSRLAKEVERKISDQSKSWAEVFEKYKDELSLEVLGDIRATIEGSARGSRAR
jgi:energy-coupling factor transporter ATP-binding protein EcfA2